VQIILKWLGPGHDFQINEDSGVVFYDSGSALLFGPMHKLILNFIAEVLSVVPDFDWNEQWLQALCEQVLEDHLEMIYRKCMETNDRPSPSSESKSHSDHERSSTSDSQSSIDLLD
jgi:hypothetical protein